MSVRRWYLTGWAVAWLLWLTIQHATWMLNFGATSMSLSTAHAVCAAVQQMNGGYVTPMCSTVSNWWGLTVFLFWFGVGALIGLAADVLRRPKEVTR